MTEYTSVDEFYKDVKKMQRKPRFDRSKTSYRTNPAESIPDYEFAPHYTRGYDEVCVFGAVVDWLHFDYSDRLNQYDRRRSGVCWRRSARKGEPKYTANRISRYLSYYFNRPTVCKCIVAGVNRSDGWDYRVYGYQFVDEVK